jgi:hypothetical protein
MTDTAAAAISSSTQVRSVTDLRNVLATSNGEHLGDIVYWALADADVQRSVLEQRWVSAGLDPKMLPEAQTPDKALRLAVRAASTNLGANRQGTLVRPTVDSANALIYAVVEEGHDASGNYFSTQKALVMLDKADKANPVISTDNPVNETAGLIVREYQRYLTTHPSRDVMTTIVKCLKAANGVTLRETGGIYWVPRTNADKVRALQGAIAGIGSSEVFVLPVSRSEQAERALQVAAAGSIEAELTALRGEIAGFCEDPDGVRPSTLDRRLATFEDLRGRATLYRSILGCTVEDLDAQLNQMVQSVETLLAQKRA